MRTLALSSVLVVIAVATGCAAAPAPPVAIQSGAPPVAAPATGCPLGVDGAGVQVTNTDDGVTMTFTSPERVEELRKRTRTAAEMHGPGEHQGLGHDGHHNEGGSHHGLQAFELPPARVAVEDVDLGARLRLTAVFPSDLETLRAKVRERAAAMTACR